MNCSRACTCLAAILLSGTTLRAQTASSERRTWPLEVSSIGATYPFVAALRGTYAVYRDSLVIDIAGGTVVSQVPKAFGEQGLARQITLSASLGQGTPESWTSSEDTPPQPVGPALPAGEQISVPALRFVILHRDSSGLRNRWLAFEVGVQQNIPVEGFRPGLLVSYVCTEDYVLGPTSASRKRAQAQRAEYSRVC